MNRSDSLLDRSREIVPLDFITFGVWLIAAPWLLGGIASPLAAWNAVISGILLVVLALPRGSIENSYAGWDRYIV